MAEPLEVAVLIDGAFITKHMRRALRRGRHPEARDFAAFAESCLVPEHERLLRVFFYDAPPFDRKVHNPISKERVDFRNRFHDYRTRLLSDLAKLDEFALRKGYVQLTGWRLTYRAVRDLLRGAKQVPTVDDLEPEFRQKCVDMKIGLDVAWLSSKRIVDRIILIANDGDFVPAMKHARREGVRVAIMEWQGHYKVLPVLREHADEVRPLYGDPESLSLDATAPVASSAL